MFSSDQYQRLAAEIQKTATEQATERRAQGISTEIRLLLVSKYQSREDIEQALDYFCGHEACPNLGESYVQKAEQRALELQEYQKSRAKLQAKELSQKQPKAWPAPQLELIGPLQSNKAEKAVQLFSTIHSVSSPKLIMALLKARKKLRDKVEEVNKESEKNTQSQNTEALSAERLNIFLQYNASGEEQKNGCRNYSEMCQLLECILPHTDDFCLRGLMCMAAAESKAAARRAAFGDCREQALRLWREFHTENTKILLPQPELSMGMSQDYREALAEGASILRIGSLLFST